MSPPACSWNRFFTAAATCSSYFAAPTDTFIPLRTAVANAPRMTEARAVKRARDIAQDMGLQKLPTDFESLPKFPAVLEALATELVEAAA